jgi:nucleoside-diphosphate-sugar epimerase
VRVLITGGAGFIGSHLADRLLTVGHEVRVLDDLSTGSLDNIRHLSREPRFDHVIASCHDGDLVGELVGEADYVYHLAAAVGVQLIVNRPVRTIETNVHCTEIVLAAANRHHRPVFIASTSEVYGKSSQLPFREDGDIVMGSTHRARWAYACSKALDEFLALAYHHDHGLPVAIGRMFNTVGPRQTGRYGMVVPRFVRQAMGGKPITVFGSGEQQRCFCHVRDVVGALAELCARDDLYGEVLNIGSTEEVSMLELARRVKRATGSDSEVVLVPYDEAYGEGFEDMLRRVPDLAKIERVLGWRATACLDEIISDVIAHELAVGAGRVPDGNRIASVRPSARADDPQPWPALSIPDSVVWVDVETEVEGDLVLFNSEADTYHSLDPTAGLVWRSIADGDGLGKIVATLTRRYEGGGLIVQDIRAFVEQAVSLGLLAVVEPAW